MKKCIVIILTILGMNVIFANSNVISAKETKIKNYGKVERYSMPLGPTWMHVYVNGKESKTTLDEKKRVVMKLGDDDTVSFGGTLPTVGKVKTKESRVEGAEATLDEEDESIDKQFVSNTGSVDASRMRIKKTDKIMKLGFKDVQAFIEAVNEKNPDKLPSQSEMVKSGFDAELNEYSGVYHYDLKELYFKKYNYGGDPVYVECRQVYGEGYDTILQFNVLAKYKKTEIQKRIGAPVDRKKEETLIQNYGLTYYLRDDHWELDSISRGSSTNKRLPNMKEYIVKKIK